MCKMLDDESYVHACVEHDRDWLYGHYNPRDPVPSLEHVFNELETLEAKGGLQEQYLRQYCASPIATVYSSARAFQDPVIIRMGNTLEPYSFKAYWTVTSITFLCRVAG